MAFGNQFIKPEFKEPAVLQILFCKIPHHTSHSQIPEGELYYHIAGSQFKFRIDAHTVFRQDAVHAASRTGVAFQGDERQGFQIMKIQGFVLILDKAPSRHKNIFNFPDGFAVDTLAGKRRTHHTEVNFPGFQESQRFRGGRIGHHNFYPRAELMEMFQVRKKIKTQGHIGSADMDFPPFQVHHLPQLFFTCFDLLIASGYIRIQKFTLLRQPDAFCTAHKKPDVQRRFQKFDRLADRRLADGKLLGRQCQRTVPGHMIKNLIIFQILNHPRSCK